MCAYILLKAIITSVTLQYYLDSLTYSDNLLSLWK